MTRLCLQLRTAIQLFQTKNGKYGTGVVIIRDTDPTRNFVGIIRVQVKPKDAVATPMVSAKQSSTVALKADGTVWTWGENTYGELGINDKTVTQSGAPVQVVLDNGSPLEDVIDISANIYAAYALTRDGSVYDMGT